MDAPLSPPVDLAATRNALHAVAEWLLAGPQYRDHGTIRLRPLQGGFATVSDPVVRVAGLELVTGTASVPLAGTVRSVGEAAGIEPSLPDLYGDHAALGLDDPLVPKEAEVRLIAGWFARGFTELRAFSPGQTPVLWPEHFDLAMTVNEVNYGLSPGDAFSDEPYAYVGPWAYDPNQPPGSSPFWNAPFGAVRVMSEVQAPEALTRFFRAGREQAARLHGR